VTVTQALDVPVPVPVPMSQVVEPSHVFYGSQAWHHTGNHELLRSNRLRVQLTAPHIHTLDKDNHPQSISLFYMIMLRHIKHFDGPVQHALPSLTSATSCHATWLALPHTKPILEEREGRAKYLEFSHELLHYILNAHCPQAIL